MLDIDDILEAQARWQEAARTGGAPAEAAARASLAGLRRAALTIEGNLARLGYPPVPGVEAPLADVEPMLRRFDDALRGNLPPSLRLFWTEFGAVSFVDFKTFAHVAFWEARELEGPHGFSDPIHVDPAEARWTDEIDDIDEDELDAGTYSICIGADGYHKDDISGSHNSILAVADWLAPTDFEWFGDETPASAPETLDLISYLRTALLECAGFPGLFGLEDFEPIRAELTRGVEIA